MSFKLLNYAANGGVRPGILVGETVYDLAGAVEAKGGGFDASSTLTALGAWDVALPMLEEIADGLSGSEDFKVGALSATELRAPILYPPNIYCAAANYYDHSKEMSDDRRIDKTTVSPYFFTKAPRQCVIGPGDTAILPVPDAKIDWEAEIAVVIGRKSRHVSQADAMNCIAGYTIMNDLSARSRNFRNDWNFKFDWFGGKSFDTSAPMGPWITPASEIEDPHKLAMKLSVSGDVKQDSTSADMIFNIPEQIEYLSGNLTLLPGDVIATGTCSGVGHPTGTYLKDGDQIVIEIEGLGRLENPVAAESR